MIASLRTRILLISSATVIGALALSGAAAYITVRANTMETIAQNLSAIAGANALAIDKWVAAKALAVKVTAEEVEHGDPQGFVKHMSSADGFPITTVGWTDKTYFSTSNTTPKDYDPTARPWYKAAVAAGTLIVTKPYGDASTGVPYVSFSAPMIRNGEATGALSGAVPVDGVREVVAAVHPTPSSLAFVVTRDGQVIAHLRSAGSACRRGKHEDRDQRNRNGQPRSVATHGNVRQQSAAHFGSAHAIDRQRQAVGRGRNGGHAAGDHREPGGGARRRSRDERSQHDG
ncbi:hypothetical protein OKW42_005371 [Paraburkholderia sp. WC7.3d]